MTLKLIEIMKKIETIEGLANKECIACRGGELVLGESRVAELLAVLKKWQLSEDKSVINRRFKFSNFEQTMKFINQIANIADINDHHPDVSFGYNYCNVNYSTHAIQGLSDNDFICAAQMELLFLE